MDKKTLQNYRAMDKELKQLEELIERIDARICEAKTSHLTPEPKGGGYAADATLNSLAMLEKLRGMYNRKWDALIALRTEIELVIDHLEPAERLLIRYRYIDGLEWYKVARKLSYSERHTKRRHGEILKKMALYVPIS